MSGAPQTFEPSQHLIKLKGKDYLEVKWRLVWLNDAVLDYAMTTDVIELTAQRCVCKTSVTVKVLDNDGALHVRSADGVGSETPQDFADYIEKAQTKSIGRALALVGFGTQFADADGFDSEAAAGRVVDAPVERRSGIDFSQMRPPTSDAATYAPQSNGAGDDKPKAIKPGNEDKPASESQINFLNSLADERGIDLSEWCPTNTGSAYSELTRETASYAIEAIKKLPRPARGR